MESDLAFDAAPSGLVMAQLLDEAKAANGPCWPGAHSRPAVNERGPLCLERELVSAAENPYVQRPVALGLGRSRGAGGPPGNPPNT